MNDEDLDRDALGDAALTLHDHGRAWKQYPWEIADLLHEKGMIADPRNKAKSVVLTEEGEARALQVLRERFARGDGAGG